MKLTVNRSITIIAGLLFFTMQFVSAQSNSALPRSTPEAQGVSSESLNRFIDTLQKSNHEFHSLMILRHGKVITDGWWKPFQPQLVHTMYSCSKSFTATAIGFLVAENKLTVEDNVISFFPEDLPDEISPNLKALRIRDLLSMSVGQKVEPTWPAVGSDNWVREFLKVPIDFEPGTKFLYNSLATYMLSAIVQKVSGEKLIDFLKPRLFGPLHINNIDWETDSRGINTGGWGLRLHTEDMAKFGQLFLQKGIWEGKQIIPAAWIEEASSMKIMQNPDATEAEKNSNDWLQGYCYQMWRSRHNSYRGDGAFGQYILVLPDVDAVVIITSETGNMQAELDLVWDYLLPAFQDRSLKPNTKEQKLLKNKLASLAVRTKQHPSNAGMVPFKTNLNAKTFGVYSTKRGLDSLRFNFNNDVCSVKFYTDSVAHEISFGNANWLMGNTTRKGPYLVTRAKNNRHELIQQKIAGSYSWTTDNTLELKILYYESPHTEILRCTFNGDQMLLEDIASFSPTRPDTIKTVTIANRNNAPRLIMRGDDMGFSHSGNLAIIKAYNEGIESSIEVLAVSPWFPEAAKLLAAHPQIEVGLHFAITSEWDNIKWRPLTDAHSLRNSDGYFYPMLYPNKNYPKQAVLENSWTPEDLEKELTAQVVLAKKYLPNLHHISGHMGSLGFSPAVVSIVNRVAANHHLIVADADKSLSYFPANNGGLIPEQKIDAFISALDKLEDGKTYLFVEHPGINDAELQAISHIGYENVAEDRQAVTDLFTSEKVKEAVVKRGIKLVGYSGK